MEVIWFGLVSLFNCIPTLFNAKAILAVEQQWYSLTHGREIRGSITFERIFIKK